jgi:transcriptional regulator with XRE-family HTH domain
MAKPKRGRSTAAIDNHVGGRIRERRIMLGLTQQQLAEMIGVTYQQAHKYERGIIAFRPEDYLRSPAR